MTCVSPNSSRKHPRDIILNISLKTSPAEHARSFAHTNLNDKRGKKKSAMMVLDFCPPTISGSLSPWRLLVARVRTQILKVKKLQLLGPNQQVLPQGEFRCSVCFSCHSLRSEAAEWAILKMCFSAQLLALVCSVRDI